MSRTPPRPPFERAARVARADGKLHAPCPLCGDVVPKGRAWWHPECVELWQYAAFPQVGLRKLIEVHGGRCWGCGLDRAQRIERGIFGPVEFEHVRPLWSLTAAERRDLKWWLPFNLQLLCRACHKAKSAREAVERYDAQNPGTPAVIRRRDTKRLLDDGQLTILDAGEMAS